MYGDVISEEEDRFYLQLMTLVDSSNTSVSKLKYIACLTSVQNDRDKMEIDPGLVPESCMFMGNNLDVLLTGFVCAGTHHSTSALAGCTECCDVFQHKPSQLAMYVWPICILPQKRSKNLRQSTTRPKRSGSAININNQSVWRHNS